LLLLLLLLLSFGSLLAVGPWLQHQCGCVSIQVEFKTLVSEPLQGHADLFLQMIPCSSAHKRMMVIMLVVLLLCWFACCCGYIPSKSGMLR